MNQARCDPDFPIETLGGRDGAQLGTKDLEGDVAVALEVAREVDDRHSSGTELALDAVALGEPVVKGVGETRWPHFVHAKTLAPGGAGRKRPGSSRTVR